MQKKGWPILIDIKIDRYCKEIRKTDSEIS